MGLDRLAEELAGADIVIASTGAPHPILRPAQLAPVMSSRAGRPMVIVDISVPRDVDTAVAGIAGVALFDIDDLERVVEANLNGRRVEAARGEGHVLDAVQGFAAWRRGLQAAPAISALRARAEEIRRAELDRAAERWRASRRRTARASRRSPGASSTSSCTSPPCGVREAAEAPAAGARVG